MRREIWSIINPPAGRRLLPGLAAAAVEGRASMGERAGQRDGRIGRDGRWVPLVKVPLCASVDGFSLHAGAWVSVRDREKLERLCRYAARPAVAESRLVELSDGRIGYSLKKRWRDGTTAVVVTKEVLMERLCALVPPPRKHLVTYHGILAPASGLRPQVVPRRVEEEGEAGGCQHVARGGGEVSESAEVAVVEAVENVAVAALRRQQAQRRVRARLRVPHGGGSRRGGRRRHSWAQLLERAFGIEILVCSKCSGMRRVLAAIHDPASIARVLSAMGLSAEVSEQAGCRSPPVGEGGDDVGKGVAQ